MWGVGSGKKIEQGEKREKYSFLTRKKKSLKMERWYIVLVTLEIHITLSR